MTDTPEVAEAKDLVLAKALHLVHTLRPYQHEIAAIEGRLDLCLASEMPVTFQWDELLVIDAAIRVLRGILASEKE